MKNIVDGGGILGRRGAVTFGRGYDEGEHVARGVDV